MISSRSACRGEHMKNTEEKEKGGFRDTKVDHLASKYHKKLSRRGRRHEQVKNKWYALFFWGPKLRSWAFQRGFCREDGEAFRATPWLCQKLILFPQKILGGSLAFHLVRNGRPSLLLFLCGRLFSLFMVFFSADDLCGADHTRSLELAEHKRGCCGCKIELDSSSSSWMEFWEWVQFWRRSPNSD